MLISEQIRAARALLRWDQKQLAAAANLSVQTIKRLEGAPGEVSAYTGTVDAISKALEGAGVAFTNGDEPGVKLRLREV